MLQMKFDLDRTADSEIFMVESVIGGTNRQTDGRTWLASHTFCSGELMIKINKQVAQWATIAHLGASIMFGNTIIYDAQWQVTLNLKVIRNKFKHTRYFASSGYLQVLK